MSMPSNTFFLHIIVTGLYLVCKLKPESIDKLEKKTLKSVFFIHNWMTDVFAFYGGNIKPFEQFNKQGFKFIFCSHRLTFRS